MKHDLCVSRHVKIGRELPLRRHQVAAGSKDKYFIFVKFKHDIRKIHLPLPQRGLRLTGLLLWPQHLTGRKGETTSRYNTYSQ